MDGVGAGAPVRAALALGAGPYGGGAPSGIQRFVGGMLEAVLQAEPGAVVFTGSRGVLARWPAQSRRVRLPAFSTATSLGNMARMVWHETTLPRALRRMRPGAYFSPVPEGMTRPPVPQVVTVHDVIPLRFPETAPRLARYYRTVLPRILEASAAVVAVSAATAREVREFYGLEDKPVHVVHQGYRSDLFRPVEASRVGAVRARHGLGDYVLSVGEARPYKNLRRLFEAFARVEIPGLDLVVVGSLDRRDPGLAELPARLGIGHRVRFLGRVGDDELAALYAGARAFVFPSLLEGFGIPPLEAMACGCPVVASRAASLPEVCGEAAVYVDPLDVDSIAEGICRTVSDDCLRADLARKGLERAATFSYERAAEEVLEIVRAVASISAGRP